MRIYKFHIFHQLILITYLIDEANQTLTLVSFGSHENFTAQKNQIRELI
ncbi:MAG: type II toxin-antitoxin system RelE/ParE family toxin [Gammaproteobacteria bacterium]